jgi:signal transduction histidine kinase
LSKYDKDEKGKAIHLMGILYLKCNSDDLVKNIDISRRLDLFAKNLSIVFEKIMFERRYNQIEKLKNSLFSISSHNIDEFFKKIVELVKENMYCEICSLFLVNTEEDNLELVASTAEKILVQKEGLKSVLDFQKDHHDGEGYQSLKAYDIGIVNQEKPYKSLTLPVLEGYTCVNFDDSDIEQPEFSDHIFYETSSTVKRHHSYLAVPLLIVDKKDVYGVIRCINKKNDHSVLYNSFTQSDKNYLIMIAGILSRFIELARFNASKQQQYSTIVHDLSSPLSYIDNNINAIEQKIKEVEDNLKAIESPFQKDRNSIQEHYDLIKRLLVSSDLSGKRRDYSIKVLLKWQRDLAKGANDNLKNMNDYLQNSDFLGKTVPVELKKISVKEIINNIVNYYQIQAQFEKMVDIKCKIDKMPNLIVDEKLFRRVIDNLIKNAVKYSIPNSGAIDVKYIGEELTRFPNTNIIYWQVIEISNFGLPITNPDKIFEYGYREVIAKKRDQSGSGIGLSAVRQCMKLMKGHIILFRQQRPVKFRLFFPSTFQKI